ncbi:hypothetical protein GO730_00410 [Spirosoma sp. HMF3257]|uniref:Uncharacterized protein n=1 Tax=Spirosoma telluris TaxID=2183553 RepID=A0A327NH35_9BACT|nr:hypothetical protein [Spirosoma telluris]RAI73266.1 hypothetical protein HMF3257_00400 [Spirosoma telluris]
MNRYSARVFLVSPGSEPGKFLIGAAYFAIVLSIGMLLEDYSKNVVSKRLEKTVQFILEKIPIIPDFNEILPADDDIRINNFLKIKREGDGLSSFIENINLDKSNFYNSFILGNIFGKKWEKYKLQPTIEKTIVVISTIQKNKNSMNYKKAKDYFEHNRTDSAYYFNQYDSLKNVVNTIYYGAKNYVFQTDNYFQELSSISIRMNFSRAVTFQFYMMFVLSYITWMIQLFAFGIKYAYNSFYLKSAISYDYLGKAILKSIVLIVIFYAIMALSTKAYVSEQTNFLLRTYGYYITLTSDNHQSESTIDTKSTKFVQPDSLNKDKEKSNILKPKDLNNDKENHKNSRFKDSNKNDQSHKSTQTKHSDKTDKSNGSRIKNTNRVKSDKSNKHS